MNNETILNLLCQLIQDKTHIHDIPLSDDNKPYVIVRCKEAGVHAGYLESRNGRECTLSESRRLWYWKPAEGKAFLSGIAIAGLHEDSKIGARIDITLTEICEVIECTNKATKSISDFKEFKP